MAATSCGRPEGTRNGATANGICCTPTPVTSTRNWAAYGDEVTLPEGLPLWQRALLTDPQTSGGLLVACAPGAAEDVLANIRAAGFPLAAIIGTTVPGPAGIVVE